MNLVRLVFFLFVLLSSCGDLAAQQTIKGIVIDEDTQQPIPFTHVQTASFNNGTITNGDGSYELSCTASDSLIFSFIGYHTKTVSVSTLSANPEVSLRTDKVLLEVLTVVADDQYLYRILKDVRKKLKSAKTTEHCKAYLYVGTLSDGQPVESSESYYNGTITKGSVRNLSFKNGQSYLGQKKDGRFFININLSKALSKYSLIDRVPSFPINPLQLSSRRMKKQFDLNLISRTTSDIQIGFTPKTSDGNFFSGTIWVDSKTNRIKTIHLDYEDGHSNLFEGIVGTEINEIKFTLDYSYRVINEVNMLNNISLLYDAILRDANKQLFKVSSESIFHAYDYNTRFHIPSIDLPEGIYDYRLFTLPPDTIIWHELAKQNQIKLTKKQQSIQNHLRKSGQRFSDDLPEKHSFFEHNYVHWSATDRQVVKKSNKRKRQQQLSFNSANRFSSLRQPNYLLEEQLRIEPILYMDFINTPGGNVYETAAMLDMYRTFNYLEVDDRLLAYTNIYFDIAEAYRRRLQKKLSNTSLSATEIDNVYQELLTEMKAQHKDLKREAFAGKNLKDLEPWNSFIIQELGIDNFKTFGLSTDQLQH